MANFPRKPAISIGESPSKYDVIPEANEVKADAEGGYEFKRKRFTRAARNMITTGFIGIKNADKMVLEAFYNTHGTTVAFTYIDDVSNVTRQVRFEDPPKWDYIGIGTTRLWSPSFKMKEV
jgi:hypothetical protein